MVCFVGPGEKIEFLKTIKDKVSCVHKDTYCISGQNAQKNVLTQTVHGVVVLSSCLLQVKNEHDATILCMTSLGAILLQQNLLDEVKVFKT